MDKISKIKAEIERLKHDAIQKKDNCKRSCLEKIIHQIGAYNKILSFINSLQEESVSDYLEEASNNYAESEEKRFGCGTEFFTHELAKAFKAGSQWQEEQFEKNRLAACDKLTVEEAEVERDFVIGIIEKEHRQPTYYDAIEYGMKKMKKQMMKDSIEGRITRNNYTKRNVLHLCGNLISFDGVQQFKNGDKVKVIIMKEE